LAGLKAGIGLVDDIDAALAPDNLVVPVATAQRFQGVTDFHDRLWVINLRMIFTENRFPLFGIMRWLPGS
jgi:hypothetical protein